MQLVSDMNNSCAQFTAGNQAGSQVTLVTLVSEEDHPSGQDVTTAASSSTTVTLKQKREWHINTICVIVFVVTLILVSAISVPLLSFLFIGLAVKRLAS